MRHAKEDYLGLTLGKLLTARATESPNHVYIRFGDQEITYSEFDRMVNRVAHKLLASGIQKGDMIGLFLDNSVEFITLFWGIARAGAVMVPMNTGYPADELQYAVTHSKQKILFAHDHLRQVVEASRAFCPDLQKVVYVGGPESNLANWLEGSPESFVEIDAISPKDLVGVLYTSGTTARPKGVMLNHHSYILGADYWCSAFACDESDTLYGFFTLFHANNGIYLLVGAVLFGCTFAFRRGFSLREHWELVRKYGATHFNTAGSISQLLVSQPPDERDKDHRLRVVTNGMNMGDMKEGFEQRFGVIMLDVYSLTECLTGTTERLSDLRTRHRGRLKSCGRPSDWVEMKICDDEGATLPNGETGEICFKGPAVTMGYLHDAQATAKAIQDGWLHTGDIGYVDEDGFLYFSDRKKDLIKRKGENIASAEVERALLAHPGVMEAAVIGVPDLYADEEVKAYVIAKPDHILDPWELIDHCRTYLEDFKVPRFIEFRESFPRPTAVPKILKTALRAEKQDLREGCFDRGPKLPAR
ncbi:hypothetical protein EDM59_05735 [Brevibacillus nitrificans]|uniref:ATP-dependent acyl-CoA ligase n=1 Tax=Brevibacillus nitrificans TaxID=651560 RepID=A0A3M8DKR8_9BACL|nr:AMP-binding protein [Brevibacillus nitrificans]RNB88614.1 hypothetical protein EDM59_05735 [Brevibacillus nitrificans]